MKDKLYKFGHKAGYYRARKVFVAGAFLLTVGGGSVLAVSVNEQIKAAEALEAEKVEVVNEQTEVTNSPVVEILGY